LAEGYYKTNFLRGKILKMLGDKNYLREFESALEAHPFPERLKSSYNQIIIDTANEAQVPLADLRKALRISPLENDEYFIDAVHPNEKGHKIIADLLYSNITATFGGALTSTLASKKTLTK